MSAAAAALLWDLDGTLIDSRPDLAAAGNHARATIGLDPLPLDTVTGFIGDGVTKLLERLCPGLDEAAFAGVMAAFREHYTEHLTDHTTAYPGVPDMLAELHESGWRMAVVSNKPDGWCIEIVRRLGLSTWLPVVIGGDGVRKPSPEPLQRALNQRGAVSAGGWMIGDHVTDLASGAAAGMRTLWCRWGFGEARDQVPTATADQARDVAGIVGAPPR